MMSRQLEALEFAYKYPFSNEAKAIVSTLNVSEPNPALIALGKSTVEKCLSDGFLSYDETKYEQFELSYIQSYAYSRLLVSALKNQGYISKYAEAQAYRSYLALERDTKNNVMKVANELGITLDIHGETFLVSMFQFLKSAHGTALALANQKLNGGKVELDKLQLAQMMKGAISKAIMAGLPIKHDEIPKLILSYAKEIKTPKPQITIQGAPGKTSAWIEKLMTFPIDDGRHRVVNLILAPYLVNVKGLDVEAAKVIIVEYIERCKTVNPMTKVNEEYIRYQCQYSKEHGSRPMSLKRASEELGGAIDFSILMEK
jgi:phage terminase small subunit